MAREPLDSDVHSLAFDHEAIREEQDRTCVPDLLRAVVSGDMSDLDWSAALSTLCWLEDYRTVRPLRAYIADRSFPDDRRLEVVRGLVGFDLISTSEERRFWWDSGDVALREYALRLMQPAEADLVLSVVEQDDHPLQAIAVATLAMGFEEPEYQAEKVRCLRSDRDDVRLAAVWAVGWDEPLAAAPVLRELLGCGDPDLERAVAHVLQYDPSLATLASLRGRASRSATACVLQEIEHSIDFIEGAIDSELERCSQTARAQLQDWTAASGFTSENVIAGGTKERQSKAKVDPDPGMLEGVLDTTVGSFSEKRVTLASIDWHKIPLSDRRSLADRLAGHPDSEVRQVSATVLMHWNDTDRLCALVEDEHALVRKSANYALASVVAGDPKIAQLALDHLEDIGASETLATFAHHAEPDQSRSVLYDLAVNDNRFSVRRSAIKLLDEALMDSAVERLLTLLGEPPTVNWDVHIALLDTRMAKTANQNDLRQLAEVDNIHVAASATRAIHRS